jgi:hypothetical protein
MRWGSDGIDFDIDGPWSTSPPRPATPARRVPLAGPRGACPAGAMGGRRGAAAGRRDGRGVRRRGLWRAGRRVEEIERWDLGRRAGTWGVRAHGGSGRAAGGAATRRADLRPKRNGIFDFSFSWGRGRVGRGGGRAGAAGRRGGGGGGVGAGAGRGSAGREWARAGLGRDRGGGGSGAGRRRSSGFGIGRGWGIGFGDWLGTKREGYWVRDGLSMGLKN